ncbi:MAG: TIGR00645 family protein [Beijerinckiaceae bacterium]
MDLERIIERVLFASRWLLVPLYLGLAALLILFSIHFVRELTHLFGRALSLDETEIILATLGLIDLVLVAGLVVMVMLAGYENYVSRLDVRETERTISWLGKLDTGTLKLKVAASLVAISAIELLRGFMEVQTLPDDKLLWMTIIHLTFVVSALLLAAMDRLMIREHH